MTLALAGLALGLLAEQFVLCRSAPTGIWRFLVALLPLHVGASAGAAVELFGAAPRHEWLARCGLDGSPGAGLNQALATALWAFPMVGITLLLTQTLSRMVGVTPVTSVAFSLLTDSSSWRTWAAVTTVALVWAPLTEELLFRLLLTDALRRAGAPLAALWAAVAFAVAHASPEQGPGLLVLGLVLQRLRDRSGNLWAAVAAHALFNAVSLAGWVVATQRGWT